MPQNDKDGEHTIKIRRPKRRVRTPVKTGTIVHKSRKTYTRKIKHKKGPAKSNEGAGD